MSRKGEIIFNMFWNFIKNSKKHKLEKNTKLQSQLRQPFLAVNFSKEDNLLIIMFFNKFKNVLKIKTIYVKKMGKLYLVCFGISSKTLKNINLKKNTKLPCQLRQPFLAVNFLKEDNLLITFFSGKFKNILKIITIYVKKWGNYI